MARQEREKNLAAEIAEHERLSAHVAQVEKDVHSSIWQWPADTQISLYRMTYQTSGSVNEDGDLRAEHETVWTITDHLDERGYIETRYWGRNVPRRTKLDMRVHFPVWHRLDISGLEDMPEDLLEDVRIQVKGVKYMRSALDNEMRFHTTEPDDYYSHQIFLKKIVPVEWVRQIVNPGDDWQPPQIEAATIEISDIPF